MTGLVNVFDRIANNYHRLYKEIEDAAAMSGRSVQDILLVAVVKNHTVEEIQALYDAGCRVFGENRLQEALPKINRLPEDCSWHMIGTLQKNKVRKTVENFTMIQSVDDPELAFKVSSMSLELNRKTPILLQVNVSGEASKHGLDPERWKAAIADILALPGVSVEGLMTMAPQTKDRMFIRQCFSRLRHLRDDLPGVGRHLSMGMSSDYKEAIAEGATILRVGSLLFNTI